MEKNIAVIWGDCSSPEIVKQTLRVLDKVAEKYGHTFHYTAAAMGGEAIDKYGEAVVGVQPHAGAPAWGCTPTTARLRSGRSWRLPAP